MARNHRGPSITISITFLRHVYTLAWHHLTFISFFAFITPNFFFFFPVIWLRMMIKNDNFTIQVQTLIHWLFQNNNFIRLWSTLKRVFFRQILGRSSLFAWARRSCSADYPSLRHFFRSPPMRIWIRCPSLPRVR